MDQIEESPRVTEADSPTTEPQTEGARTAGTLRPGFLSELAMAMQATAGRERGRIAETVAADAKAHVEKVRSRAAIETEELRRLADDDVQHIEAWSATEIDRIRTDATQKIDERRASLEDYLKQHDAIIETEIQGVDSAVREYDATLDRFFAELAESGDPSEIVARAEALPAPPDLDQVRARARASAMTMILETEDEVATPDTSAISGEVATDEPGSGTDADAGIDTRSDSPDVEEFVAATADADGSNGSGETDAVGSEQAAATGEPVTSEDERSQAIAMANRAAADPVPVMDPEATANSSWPPPEAVAIAPTIDHTSAAVRLLRSVAPWTAPTHAGAERPRSDSGPDSD